MTATPRPLFYRTVFASFLATLAATAGGALPAVAAAPVVAPAAAVENISPAAEKAREARLARLAKLERLAYAGKIVAGRGGVPADADSAGTLDEIANALRSDCVFEQALAHAAATQVVGQANNGDIVLITAGDAAKPDAPAWLREYARTSASRDTLAEFDWIRHLYAEKKLFDAKALAGEMQLLAKRAAALHALSPRSPLPAPCSLSALRRQWLDARRALRPAVIAAAGLGGADARLLLFTRHGYHHKPNVCGAHTSWAYKPGGDILALDVATGTATPLLRGRLGAGHFHGLDLSFDAHRIVFAFAPQPVWPPRHSVAWPGNNERPNTCFARQLRDEERLPPVNLWEADLTSEAPLRRLTDHNYWSDTEPAYLPDGGIVFASDRSAHGPSCDWPNNDLSDLNLYVLDAARARIRRLLNHKDIDTHPRVLNNGLIAYLRWEYQERHFMETHSVWTARPDGTAADALFKQHNIVQPYSVRLAENLGNTGKLIAVATGHHWLPQGALVVLDPAAGGNNPDGVRLLTRGAYVNEGTVPAPLVPEGGRTDAGGHYTDPKGFSDNAVLCSYAFPSVRARRYTGSWQHHLFDADSNAYGVYLLDLHGNKELLYRDPFLGAYGARPLRPRKTPPVLPDNSDRSKNYAVCTIPDVEQGMTVEVPAGTAGDAGDGKTAARAGAAGAGAAGAVVSVPIPRGTVKYIRISEALPWVVIPGQGTMAWHTSHRTRWCPVRVIGEVPVEADGSAHFKVPVSDNASVYFQALDANKMEVRRMRSSVSFAPGEQRGCTGCHETRPEAVQNLSAPTTRIAFRRPPSEPVPPPWGAENAIHFPRDVQPVLDRNCVRCHGAPRPAGGLDFTAGRALNTIHSNRLASIVNYRSDNSVTRVKQFGSHRSRLARALVEQDKMQVKLRPDEWLAIVTWLDANTPSTGLMQYRQPNGGLRWGEFAWSPLWAPPRDTPALGDYLKLPEKYPPAPAAAAMTAPVGNPVGVGGTATGNAVGAVRRF
ncbi:MAG: hypothetical protein LBR07_04180 [Puniceicoccales bacterium]|jgi:hypothetical protein|nr:hypothetical protein [Puniceicoccales bacterium]